MPRQQRTVRDLPIHVLAEPGPDGVALQLEVQDGVITRSQLAALGVTPGDLERMLRRRDLTRLASGVFINHTGEPSWIQNAWAQVMTLWPAALDRESVWKRTTPLYVAVDRSRRVSAPRGVQLHQLADFGQLVEWHRNPPSLHPTHAALNAAAAAADTAGRVAVLSDVVQRRRTGYAALERALTLRPRLTGRAEIATLLTDLKTGANSFLEHAYLVLVERPHGLPSAERQFVSGIGGRRSERDAVYRAFGVYVELDGRAFHDNAWARDRDMERDLDAAVEAAVLTIRLGHGQVTRRPCSTAAKVAALLRRGGWTGEFVRCPNCPALPRP